MADSPRIIAVIPAFNVEDTIASVVVRTARYVDEVVVVDDGSTDLTGKIAESIGATVLVHDRNRGKGAALKTAFKYLKKRRTRVVVSLDGDGQHDPEHIPRLIEPVKSGEADIVIGSRKRSTIEAPAYRRLGRGFLDKITGVDVSGESVDTQSGYRAYSEKVVESLEFYEEGFGVDSEILMKAESSNYRIVSVDVEEIYTARKRKNPLAHGLQVVSGVLIFMGEKHAVLSLGLPGLIMVIGGLYGWLWVTNRYFEINELAIGTALIATVILIIGAFAIFTGLILFTISTLHRRYR